MHDLKSLKRYFAPKEISNAIKNNRILTLSLELPVRCNLECKYCYGSNKIGNLKSKEFVTVIKEAVNLGIKSVSIVGEGEPMMYKDGNKDIFYLIDEINQLSLPVVIFTNNTFIDKITSQKLFKRDTIIIGKLNSLNTNRQKKISGSKYSYKIFEGFNNLKEAGFNKTFPSRLAIHSVIVKDNYNEICDMWEMCREENIIPYFQVFVPPYYNSTNRKYINQLKVSKEKIKELFFKLNIIDKNKYGFRWDPNYTYPIAGLGCSVVKSGCAVDSFGNVKICGYLNQSLGNVRRESLRSILLKKEVRSIRRFKYYHIKQNEHFYGCRATAFNLTGDRFAPDPFFWKR